MFSKTNLENMRSQKSSQFSENILVYIFDNGKKIIKPAVPEKFYSW